MIADKSKRIEIGRTFKRSGKPNGLPERRFFWRRDEGSLNGRMALAAARACLRDFLAFAR